MFRGKVLGTIVLLSILLSSYAFSPVVGHHEGLPAYLGVWVKTATMSGHRVIDTAVTGGNVTVNLNVTNSHRSGLTGANGFDITITYNPALFKARAAGIASFAVTAAAPSGARLEPICPAADGCIFDLAGRTIIAFRVDLDMTFDAATNTLSSTPGKARVFVTVSGANAASNGIALRFRLEARSVESVVYDSNNNGVYNTGEPVIAGATPANLTPVEDTDIRLKYRDNIPTGGNDVWAPPEGVVRDTNNNNVYDPGEPHLGGVPPPFGSALEDTDGRIKYVDANNNNILDVGAASGSSDIKIDTAAPTQLTVSGQQVRYIKLDGFFSNQATAPNYIVSAAPNAATVAPTQGATATVTVGSPLGTPGSVSFASSRVVSPLGAVEFPAGDPSVGLSLSPATGTPPFTSTLFITTTKDTVRGTHTILLNATSSSIPGGVIASFILTVEYPPIDFTSTVSRNLIVLRPGENSPDVLFIDSNRNGHYDSGEPLVLDANLDIFADPGDRVVSVTPHRTPSPGVRFIDVNVNSAYDALLEEFVAYDSNSNGLYDSGEPFFGGVAPAGGTLLVDDPKIRYHDLDGNNVWTQFIDAVVYDTNSNGVYDTGEPVIDGIPPAGVTATKDDPKLRFDDFNGNAVRDIRGETLVFDANLDKTVDAGDRVVSVTPHRAPNAAELGKPLADVELGKIIGFIDANSNNAYDFGEKLVLDSNQDGFSDSFPAVGASLVDDPKIKYVDANNNNVRDSGETVVYDTNANNEFDTGDILIAATETPAFRSTLKDDARIKYVDANSNAVWNQGESVAYDQNSNGLYNSGEPVIAGDILVSESPPRSPTGTEVGATLKGELGKALKTFGEIGQPLLAESRIRFIDGNANAAYDLGETLVFDADNTNTVGSGDTVVSQSPPRAPTAGELGLALLSAPKVRFIDLNGNNAYGVGETLVFDSQPNAVVDASDTVVSASQRTPIARIKFIDGAPGSGDLNRFNTGEKLVLDADHNGAVSVGDTIVSTDPPTAVIAGNPDIGKPLLEVEIVLTVTWTSPITGTSLKDDVKIRYVDSNNNDVWNAGEAVFYDSNSNGLYDVAEPMIALAAPPIGTASKDDPKIRYVDRDNDNVRDLNEYVNYDTNSNAVYDSGEPVILGAGPEVVSLFPPNPHPVDSTLITELARTSGDVSGPAAPGVETKTLVTTVKLKTQLVSGTQAVAPWTRLPVMLTVSVGARSDVSGVAKTAEITLILAKEGYRTDLPFDYKLTVHSDTPLPAPAAASGIRVQLDKGQTITVTLTVNATQGMPQNVTITILTVDPTIAITVTGITHSTTVLSSWVTTITISTTTLTPSVTGGYTIVTASPGGGSPPTPADEVIKLCVLFRGDVNNDGTVNVSDLARVGASFLKSTGQPGFDAEADINKDGTVNVLDLVVVGAEFLKSC